MKKILVWILTLESRLILNKYKPFIVAVTGSVGKTSTKDAIYDVLKGDGVCADQKICFVRKSDKSMNSDIGLPLTVIGVPNAWRSLSGWLDNISAGAHLIFKRSEYPDCLVLEIGADHPGDIRKIAHWLHPDIAVITKISRTPVHVEFFRSPEEVFEEKASLAEAVKTGGTLVLFNDDEKVAILSERVKSRNVSLISFGLSETAAVRAEDIKVLYDEPPVKEWKVESSEGLSTNEFKFAPKTVAAPVGMSFKLTIDYDARIKTDAEPPVADQPQSVAVLSQSVSVKGILGKSYLYPLLAAAAVGKARGIGLQSIFKSLSNYDAPKGRMRVIHGLNGSTLIDDTYNSSPDAVIAAFETLKGLECAGAKIAILGDMMELGKYSAEEHRRIGREAAGVISRLVTVGQRSRLTAEEAAKAGLKSESISSFASAAEAARFITPLVKTGDIILVKGSQSVRVERVSAALLYDPDQAAKLLVRQEKEWLLKK
jgi:UDP-N-acetylmuramoyl-tripeptide--D-alanyl-D-alanine ligase